MENSAGRAIFLATAFFLAACDDKAKQVEPAAPAFVPVDVAPDLWKEFSGEKAMALVQAQVEIGPRPSGSAGIEKARKHIVETLVANGWEAERQEFKETPVAGRGEVTFANIIARFPVEKAKPASRTSQRAIVGSHYDTKVMTGTRFLGANDGGSSTGALLELARVLAKEPAFASQFELVFFDGEEALVAFGDAETGTDGLVGSRYYAREIRGRAKQYRFALVWDMIGDKDLTITLPSDSPQNLSGSLFTAAESLGFRKHFSFFHQDVLDDHVPIARIARIPAMDIIDFDYAPWHTGGDTLDKLSPQSLEIVGRVTLKMLLNELVAK